MGLAQRMADTICPTPELPQIMDNEPEIKIRPDLEDDDVAINVTGPALAQLKEEKEGPKHCHRTANRAKKELPNFWAIRAGSDKWVDPEFTTDADAFYWKDAGEYNGTSGIPNGKWARANSYNDEACLLGNSGPGADEMDIDQGQIGNCWILSSASSLAHMDNRADKLFVSVENKLPESGIHAFNFYSLGVPATIVIDDQLPLNKWGDLVFAD